MWPHLKIRLVWYWFKRMRSSIEHVIYYLSRNLIDVELRYSHVEKLALTTIYAVKHLRHYILLRQTLVVSHINPFQSVLTKRMIGGKYNKWIFILQEFVEDVNGIFHLHRIHGWCKPSHSTLNLCCLGDLYSYGSGTLFKRCMSTAIFQQCCRIQCRY